MRVAAFAASFSTSEEADGGVTATGFPMTSCFVDRVPCQVTIPVVVAVYANGGQDYDPTLVIAVTGPDGQRVGSLEFSWHWHDNPPSPVKYRVFAQYVPIRVESAGLHTFALLQSREDTDSEHVFPLPIYQRNPLLPGA